MNQITTELDEKTQLIKHYLKAQGSNMIAVGRELQEINEKKLYKLKYNTFEEYVKDTFDFKKAYAYNYIKIYKKYGQNVQRLEKWKDLGMRLLIISLYVPEDKIEEAFETAETLTKANVKVEDIAREVKRFAKEVGSEPDYLENLPLKERESEYILKLKREAETLKEDYEKFKEIKINLILGIKNWIKSAQKFKELYVLKVELESIQIDLK